MKITNFFKVIVAKVYRRKPKTVRSREVRALFHWEIMVISFLLATVLVFAGGLVIYQDVSKKGVVHFKSKDSNSEALMTLALLNKTVGFFKTKSETFNKLRKARGISIDPSI